MKYHYDEDEYRHELEEEERKQNQKKMDRLMPRLNNIVRHDAEGKKNCRLI